MPAAGKVGPAFRTKRERGTGQRVQASAVDKLGIDGVTAGGWVVGNCSLAGGAQAIHQLFHEIKFRKYFNYKLRRELFELFTGHSRRGVKESSKT